MDTSTVLTGEHMGVPVDTIRYILGSGQKGLVVAPSLLCFVREGGDYLCLQRNDVYFGER